MDDVLIADPSAFVFDEWAALSGQDAHALAPDRGAVTPRRAPRAPRTARTAAERGLVGMLDLAPPLGSTSPPMVGGLKASPKRVTRNKNANASNAGKHTSAFRGVTLHRWTGRYEAHLWDSTQARAPTSTGTRRRGRQVYLGGYDTEMAAAKAYGTQYPLDNAPLIGGALSVSLSDLPSVQTLLPLRSSTWWRRRRRASTS